MTDGHSRNRFALPLPEILAMRATPWLLIAAALVCLFGPTLCRQVESALAPENMSDDVRIVNYYFWSVTDPSLFTNDTLGRYHSEGTSELYRALYYLAAKAGHWHGFTKLMPFVLLLTCLIGVGIAARRIGGYAAAFFSMALVLSSPVFLGRMAGLLPRAYAYPILALLAAALVTGRIRTVAGLTLLGAGFYPVVTVIGLMTLGLVLFVCPAADRGSAREWSFPRRIVVLALTFVACVALTLPFNLRMRAYGHTIGAPEIAAFPEAGPGGRQDAVTAPPHAPLPKAWVTVARAAITGAGASVVPPLREVVLKDSELSEQLRGGLAFLTVLGITLFGLQISAPIRRLAALVLAIGVGYLIASQVAPRLVVPQRYVLYGVPIVVVLTVPTFVLGFLPSTWSLGGQAAISKRSLAVIATGCVVLGCFGGRGRPRGGLGRYITDEDRPLFDAVARLRPDVLVAGWPEGTMDTLPVATHRTPFLSKELHVPYHTEIALLTRRRMYALIDAYFATEPGPLWRLRDEFKVTHLVVEWSKLETAPKYFLPFGSAIAEAHARGQSQGFEIQRQLGRCAIFRGEKHALLDLSCSARREQAVRSTAQLR